MFKTLPKFEKYDTIETCNSVKIFSNFYLPIELIKRTNYELTDKHAEGEDAHLTAKNKWLLGHPEGGLPEGSPMGLVGKNLCIND